MRKMIFLALFKINRLYKWINSNPLIVRMHISRTSTLSRHNHTQGPKTYICIFFIKKFEKTALRWLAMFHGSKEILATLLTHKQTDKTVWGVGRLGKVSKLEGQGAGGME